MRALEPWHLIVLLVVVLVLFGGKRLPDAARGLGRFLSDWFYQALLRPITESAAKNGTPTTINFADPLSAFNQRIQICLVIGVVLSSPVWLYQFWAFITPGLTRKERRYGYGFVAA